MKALRYLFVAAVLALGGAAGAADKSPTAAAVVVVDVGRFSGSGVAVGAESGYSLVVTNRHITNLATTPNVFVEHGGTKYPAVSVIAHPSDDLTLLVVKGTIPDVAALADDDPAPETAVTLYGYDWRGQGKLIRKEGKTIAPDGVFFQSTLEPVSGDSGGGVFDAAGLLVSVNHGFAGSYENRGPQLGLRLATLRAFIRERVGDRFPRLAGKCREQEKAAKPAAKPEPKKVDPPKAAPAKPAPVYQLQRIGNRYYYVEVPPCAAGKCPAPAVNPFK